jgi:hypothetical protein
VKRGSWPNDNLNTNAARRDADAPKKYPPIVIDWLEEFGDEQFDGHGGLVTYFSRQSKRRIEQRFGRRFVAENAR